VCEECEICMKDVILKSRRGIKQIENNIMDIYTLSHFYLDKQISDEINEIFCLRTKPFEYIKEKSRIKFLVDKVYTSVNSYNPTITEESEMTNDEKLEKILSGLSSVQLNIETILKTQTAMQSQLDKNTSELEQVKKDVINLTINNDVIMDSDNSNRKRRRETDSLVLEETNKMTTLSRDNSSPKSTSQAMLYSTATTSRPLIKKVDDNNRKKTKVIGKGISSDIKAAEKTFNVFINNVDINDSEEKVVQTFKLNNIEVKECVEFNKRIKNLELL